LFKELLHEPDERFEETAVDGDKSVLVGAEVSWHLAERFKVVVDKSIKVSLSKSSPRCDAVS
jgi:hypothetical protein